MHDHSSTGTTPLRRLGSALIGATLVGALVAPAAALAVVNTPPVAVTDAVTAAEDATTPTAFFPLANDTDVEGDTLGLTALTSIPANKGTLVVHDLPTGELWYTPAAGYSGTFSTTYTVSDGTTAVSGTINFTVTAVNDVPVALDKDASTDEDTAVGIAEATLLAGATDGDGDTLTVSAVGNDDGGTVAWAAAVATFTPAADLCGNNAAGFDYTVSDGNGGTDTARVTVDITCVEDLPVADDQVVNVVYNTAKAITLAASDGEDDTLTWTKTDPAHGVLSGTMPNLTYTPTGGYIGPDSFTFFVNDGDDDSNTATVSITVAADVADPVVAAPVVVFGTGRVNETAPLKLSWSATDVGTGVKTYTVEAKVGSGAWTQIYTGAGTSTTRSYALNQDLYWRVKAEDNAGNISDWRTSAKRKLAAYQGGSPVTYSGTWRTVTSSGSSGTGYKYTTTLGKKVALSFTGMGVLYVAPKTSSAGYVKVSTGGVTSRINLRASSTSLGVIVKSKMWSTVGSHAIKVVNDSSGRRATFDVFVVLK